MIDGKDSCGFLYKQLPTVVQSSKPRIDANGHELHGGRTEKLYVRNYGSPQRLHQEL